MTDDLQRPGSPPAVLLGPWKAFHRLSQLLKEDHRDLEGVLEETARIVASVWDDQGRGVARIEAAGFERTTPGFEPAPGLSFTEIDRTVWIHAGRLDPQAPPRPGMSPIEEETFLAAVGKRIQGMLHRRRILAAAQRRDGSLLDLFENAPMGMALVGPSHQLLRVNRPLSRILGYSDAELLQRSIVDLTHPEDIGQDARDFDRMYRREIESYQMEKRYIRRDGMVLWGFLTATLLRDREDHVVAGVGMLEDITLSKRIEAWLSGSESCPPVTGPRAEVSTDPSLWDRETILVVENDPVILRFVSQILLGEGYRVIQARDGREALQFCEDVGAPLDLLLTDVVMEGLSGREVTERLWPVHPRMAVVYMSGFPEAVLLGRGLLETGSDLLDKPFTVPQLLRKVRQALDARSLGGAMRPSGTRE